MSEEVLKIVLNKVEKIESKISNAKSMNGGFDKLLLEVQHIKEAQVDILEGVRGVKRNLYEPDSGLFSRVKELEMESSRRQEYIDETKPIVGQHQELLLWKKQVEKEVNEVEDLRLEVAKLQDWKSGMQKVIWLVATAAGGMWVKHFMDLMMK
jgi:chromosome segregation ATPase